MKCRRDSAFHQTRNSMVETINVRSAGLDNRFRDPQRAAITAMDDPRLDQIEQFGDKMKEIGQARETEESNHS